MRQLSLDSESIYQHLSSSAYFLLRRGGITLRLIGSLISEQESTRHNFYILRLSSSYLSDSEQVFGECLEVVLAASLDRG